MSVAKPLAARDGFGKALVSLGSQNRNIVVLTADVADSLRVQEFAKKFPDRFIDVGVAEQNMMGIAAGLALSGKTPFVAGFAVFCPGRTWDQLRVSVCYNNANVKVVGGHAGVSVGADGATHQALEDIAIVRVLPGIAVIVPCDYTETMKATEAVSRWKGPCYLRFSREASPVVTAESTPFEIGKAEIFRDGSDVAIIACGLMVHEALVAASELEKQGIRALVVNNHTIKPIDRNALLSVARKCGCVVTAEEHQVSGGMGSAVMEVLAESAPVPVVRVGMPDCFGQSGKASELFARYGMTSKDIVKAAKNVLKMKSASVSVMPRPETLPASVPSASKAVSFRLFKGGELSTLQELHKSLKSMDNEVFCHHCNGSKNDFAAWVADVFNDAELAFTLRQQSTRAGMAAAIGLRLSQHFMRK